MVICLDIARLLGVLRDALEKGLTPIFTDGTDKDERRIEEKDE
jgi:hypothetical protein